MADLQTRSTGGSPGRRMLGLCVGSRAVQLTGAVVETTGRGQGVSAKILTARQRLCPALAVQFAGLDQAGTISWDRLGKFGQEVVQASAELVAELLTATQTAPHEVTGLAVGDPGWIFQIGQAESHGYLPMVDSVALAHATGLPVVDAFPAADLAQHGLGGPLGVLADSALLPPSSSPRVILDLGRTTRLSYVPASDGPAARCLAFDVGPGMELVDALAQQLTQGQQQQDPGGRLAVQGSAIQELIEHWLADGYFRRPIPRWNPRGLKPQRFLFEAQQLALKSGWSIRDLLCTATHLIAVCVEKAIHGCIPKSPAVSEVLLTGGGQNNGLLLRELTKRLSPARLRPLRELGIPEDAHEAAEYAVLGLFTLDGIACNTSSITGAKNPCVLGRITPRPISRIVPAPHTKLSGAPIQAATMRVPS